MLKKRYEIQFAFIDDVTARGNKAMWYSLSAGASRRRRKAVENWWDRVSNNQEFKIFRLMDTKTGKVIR